MPNVPLPRFPISLTDLMARAKTAPGASPAERIFNALKANKDTLLFLDDMCLHAFIKGAAIRAVPVAKNAYERRAREILINSVFAHAKTVRSGEIRIPGRAGKVFVREEDMLPPSVQYGLGGGTVDLTGLETLQSLNKIGYVIDEAEAAGLDADAKRQLDWAHGEHVLQGVDTDLKALGIHANTPDEALVGLLDLGDPDPELAQKVAGLGQPQRDPVRDYGTFRASAWYAPEAIRGKSIRPQPIPTAVRQALFGSLLVEGDWDSLGIPRAAKAEAFDRLVALFTAAFEKKAPTTVAANTDDLVGKAAIMAAKRLNIKTVAVQLAGWPFKPAQLQAQFCERLPLGNDVQIAQADLRVMLAESVSGVLTLGDAEQISHLVHRQGKRVTVLTPAWVKHNGLY